MKNLLLFIMMCMALSGQAQTRELGQMSIKARNRYLVKLAKEVVMHFGPEYYRTYKKPIVLDPIPFDEEQYKGRDAKVIKKYSGRRYYRVVIPYDFTKEMLSKDYAAIVYIWEDDGTPAIVNFGDPDPGFQFLYISYEQRLKDGIPPNMVKAYVQSSKLKPGDRKEGDLRSWER